MSSKVSLRPDLGQVSYYKYFLWIVIAVTLYLSFFEKHWIRWIPVETHDLRAVAKTGFVKGQPTRRLKNDTLHLPLNEKAVVYEGDVLITDDDSSVEIYFDEKNFFVQEPDSILKINQVGSSGVPYLHLFKGNLSTHFTEDMTIKIQYGVKTNEVQIRKGTYFIKNSGAGIQITAFALQSLIKKGQSDESNLKYKSADADFLGEEQFTVDDINENEKNNKEDVESQHLPEAMPPPIALKLPYPPKDAVLLVQSETAVYVAAKTNCEGTCSLKVEKNEKVIFDKNFEDGEFAKFPLLLNKSSSGAYHWKFNDQRTFHEENFTVMPYSDAEFQKALDAGKAIELL